MSKPLTIGNLSLFNNLFLAPMAGITNVPMRLLARECGASLCFTEMVSVNGLVRDGEKSLDLIRSPSADRPLGIQIFGDNPQVLAEGARRVADFSDLIDINMGCPVKKVVNSGAGSSLLRTPSKVGEIIRLVRQTTNLPLTIKIRTGWGADDQSFLEIGRIAEAEGCDAITLHPRTRGQMFEGHADWSKITELKRSSGIPIIGSGDLFTAEDAANMLLETGCDGVMIARGALGNPWIFREILALITGQNIVSPSSGERLAMSLRHLELFVQIKGEQVALREMRKHISWYARKVPGAARFRDMINRTEGLKSMTDMLQAFFNDTKDCHGRES